MTTRRIASLLGFSCTVLATAAAQKTSTADSIVHLYQGQDTHTHYVLRALVQDSASFARLWDQIVTAPMPRVDFNRYMVIAATMGPQGSPGNQIAIVAVDSSGRILQVRTELTLLEGLGLGAIAYPADVVRLPKSRRTGISFVDRYSVVRYRRATPRVPALPPDSVPSALWDEVHAPENIIPSSPEWGVPFPRNLIVLAFKEDATQTERQQAIDAVGGEVIGGEHIDRGGYYYVRIRSDGTADALFRAITKLKTFPKVDLASPEPPPISPESALLP
jgi:hypothetical protein